MCKINRNQVYPLTDDNHSRPILTLTEIMPLFSTYCECIVIGNALFFIIDLPTILAYTEHAQKLNPDSESVARP